MAKDIKPQVPGEQQTDEPDTVTVPAGEFAQMQARLAAIEAGGPRRQANSAAGLPDADSVDVSTLQRPVLTKTGWLVPPNFGRNPAQKAL